MREMSVAEQRYQAVLAVVGEGRTVTEVAGRWGVSRQTLHAWLARYEAEGLEGLADRSHRPRSCPHQMPGEVAAGVLELRRAHPGWGPRRLVVELARRGVVVSESAVYRCLSRAGVIEPGRRRRRKEAWRRWERGEPMELWQLDVVGGFLLADGTTAKALTGVDDHSRFCVSARLMPRERTQPVCDALALALRTHGVPQQVLTDNGRVFTGRFAQPPVEVLFDRICRENGIEHLLTAPRSPTTTGKIERFHRTLRAEFDTARTFPSLRAAQAELDEWVGYYNHDRPHQSLDDATPASRFHTDSEHGEPVRRRAAISGQQRSETPDEQWVSRKVGGNGVVCVAWQQVSVGKHHAGAHCDVLVTDQLLQFWIGRDLLKTVARTSTGDIRNKRAQRSVPTRPSIG
jgi:transposase InsO family protein